MSYKQKAIDKLAEMEGGTRGVIAATIRLCIAILKEIPEEEISKGSHYQNFRGNFPQSTPDTILTYEEDAWFPASEPPEESGQVMVCGVMDNGRISYINDVSYSAKYKTFNCRDWYDNPSEHAIYPKYWKPMPERVEDLRIRTPKET